MKFTNVRKDKLPLDLVYKNISLLWVFSDFSLNLSHVWG